MPSVVTEHGPMQRFRSASLGLFNAIGSDVAWAHAKVLLASCPTSYGPIQRHWQWQSMGPCKGLARQLSHQLWAHST
jgi:hypothetical protein